MFCACPGCICPSLVRQLSEHGQKIALPCHVHTMLHQSYWLTLVSSLGLWYVRGNPPYATVSHGRRVPWRLHACVLCEVHNYKERLLVGYTSFLMNPCGFLCCQMFHT